MSSPPDYREAVREDERLAILNALAGAPDYTVHEHLLRAHLLGQTGNRLSAAQLRGHLAWLEEAGLVLLGGGAAIMVPTLTLRGADVAGGLERYPGVARPRPV